MMKFWWFLSEMVKKTEQLFKYFPPSDNAIKNLQNNVIYCQHYSKYNDPFEFWNHIYDGIPDPIEEPERFSAALKEWGMDGCDPNDSDLNAYFDECKDYQPPFEKMRDSIRLACFASDDDNMLMWSYYADGLRGFCIVFDEPHFLNDDEQAYVLDVRYQQEPPTIDSFVYAIASDQEWYNQVAIEETQAKLQYFGDLHNEQSMIPLYEKYGALAEEQMKKIWQDVFAVKPIEWNYENERRLLVHTNSFDDKPISYPYPRSSVREVILGERMDSNFKDQILSIINTHYPKVVIKTAKRAKNQYSIVIE
ncbi:DUF2971 domain-containing protein [Vibrio lentus]